MTDAKPYRHRFPMTIIQHAVWLYHRFPLSYRDVQELLHQRGIEVSHETLREWCINSDPSSLKACVTGNPGGVPGGIWTRSARVWMAFDIGCGGRWTSTGSCSIILLQRHRDTEAAKTFLTRLLGEYDVPETIHTDQLRSYWSRDPGDPEPGQRRPPAGDLHGPL